MKWNPRYENYARIHNQTPDGMLALDDERYPGGRMTGFLLWNSARIAEFKKINPDAFFMGHLYNHEDYDMWLSSLSVQGVR